MRARSREGGGIGQAVFTQTATPTCPAGQHWVPDAVAPIRSLSSVGACVANQTLTLHLRPPAAAAPPATAPAPQPPPPAFFAGEPTPTAAPSGGGAAPAPQALVCPTPWSLWWLAVAFAAGAVGGHLYVKNEKKVKKNAGRLVGVAAQRAVNAGMTRLLG